MARVSGVLSARLGRVGEEGRRLAQHCRAVGRERDEMIAAARRPTPSRACAPKAVTPCSAAHSRRAGPACRGKS
jgi:hypothetical protein